MAMSRGPDMVTSLGRNFQRFESWLTTIGGARFRGCILPASDTVSPGSLLENRLVLRTRPNEPVVIGSLINDAPDRTFLVARDDTQIAHGALAKTFRLFAMTTRASWQRVVTVTDVVTGLAQRTGFAELGPIWCAIEILSNIADDRGTHMAAERRHVITGSVLQLQDKVDGNIVRRVTPTFGIYVAEIE